MLMVSLALFTAGAILSAVSQTFVFYIAATVILCLGRGAIAPLCFSVLGDLFAPAQRSRWSGLLNIPAGVASIVAPTLVGMITDRLSWRYFFWIIVPLALVSAVFVFRGVPPPAQRAAHRIDILGAILLAVASSTMILGFSWAGATYPWASVQIVGLLLSSLIFWTFFFRVEHRAEEPMLDPQVFTNRTLLTAALSGLMSCFGMVGATVYYPLFLQGVQGTSATLSGQVITPFNIMMTFMGIPAGFLLARTKRYKWMYIAGYAILTATMFVMITFNAATPVWLGVLVTALAGFGLGTIPTINALVVQFAVPKRMLGVAVGAIFFFVFLGSAVAPAIQGSAMNAAYAKALQGSLPAELKQVADEAVLESLTDSRVLLSPQAMEGLRKTLAGLGSRGPALLEETVQAIRSALETSLKTVFVIGAAGMLVSFLLILTIPEVSMDAEVRDKREGKV
jgi:MFS family permease